LVGLKSKIKDTDLGRTNVDIDHILSGRNSSDSNGWREEQTISLLKSIIASSDLAQHHTRRLHTSHPLKLENTKLNNLNDTRHLQGQFKSVKRKVMGLGALLDGWKETGMAYC
jgi:hypothetical protein